MRTLLAAALVALVALPCLAAKKKAASSAHAPSAGRRFFGRVFQAGRLTDGRMLQDSDVPPELKYRVVGGEIGGVAAVDSSWCVAHFGLAQVGLGEEVQPYRVVDRGCTGLLVNSKLDWGGQTPTPMTQSRLDALYADLYRHEFGK